MIDHTYTVKDGPLRVTEEVRLQRLRDHPDHPLKDMTPYDCSAARFIKVGKGREGYNDADAHCDHVDTKTLPLFKMQYPNAVPVGMYDHSSAHGAWSEDALKADRLIKADGGKSRHITKSFEEKKAARMAEPQNVTKVKSGQDFFKASLIKSDLAAWKELWAALEPATQARWDDISRKDQARFDRQLKEERKKIQCIADCGVVDENLCSCQTAFTGHKARKENLNKWLLRDTTYVHAVTNETCVQKMQFPDDHPQAGQQKGSRSVLVERGESTTDAQGRELNHQCQSCKKMSGLYDFNRPDTACCLLRKVALLPDFRAEKPRIFQIFEKHGGICIFLPAFHCELNFIERVWADIKRWIRKHHSGDKSMTMRRKMERAIDRIPVATCRRYARTCERMESVYRIGLSGPLAFFAAKQYTSHRAVPSRVNAWMDDITWTETQKKDHIRACAAADDISETPRYWTPGVSLRKITGARVKVKSAGPKTIIKEEKVTVLRVVNRKSANHSAGKPAASPAAASPFVGRKFYKAGAVGSPGDFSCGKQYILGTVMSIVS